MCLLAEVEFEKVVFLYHLERGRAAASYGLNVACLAGLPESILQSAHRKSKKLEGEVTRKALGKEEDKADSLRQELHLLLTFLNRTHVSLSQALRTYPFPK